MNSNELARVLDAKAADLFHAISDDDPKRAEKQDIADLIRVLRRIVVGIPIGRAFGAPGDWGYDTPIGKALAGQPE